MSSCSENGKSYFVQGQYEPAISCYSEAITKDAKVATLYTNRALCYLKTGCWSRVVEDCQEAIQLNHDLIKAHFFMGQALIEMEKYDDALVCLKTAHELAKQQRKNFGEDITSAIRFAKKKRWNALEENGLKQESELQSLLTKLLREHKDRQLTEMDVTASVEQTSSGIEIIQREYDSRISQLNDLFLEADKKRKCRDVPDYLCGKISFDLMTDPCVTPSGITYDRKDIEEHLQRVGHFDPVTRQELTEDQLIPNLAMKEVVDAFIDKNQWVEDY